MEFAESTFLLSVNEEVALSLAKTPMVFCVRHFEPFVIFQEDTPKSFLNFRLDFLQGFLQVQLLLILDLWGRRHQSLNEMGSTSNWTHPARLSSKDS